MATTLQGILFSVVLISFVRALPQAQKYPLRLQPELDTINVEDYFRNDRLLDLQIKCVVYDGPCDAVGRWVKPRVGPAFFGECPICTPMQKKNVEKIVTFIQEKRPDVYRQAVVKFLKSAGVETKSSSTTSPVAGA